MGWPFLDIDVPFGFAHQGGDDVAPSNTEASFEHAVSLGYRYIETDVQVTSDGVLVIFHDDDLGPITGVPGRIEDLTWAEISELRVGDDHRLPRFEDVVLRFPSTRFNIDPKTDRAVEPLIDAIRRLDLLDRVAVGSFSDSRVRRVQAALGGELATSPGPIGTVAVLLRALIWPRPGTGYAALQIPPRYRGIPLAVPFLIERLHRMDLQVHFWTINERAEMEKLLDAGADAIMTDRTELLRTVLEQRGNWPDDGGDRE